MSKKITKTVRVDEGMARRVQSYAEANGLKESDAIRELIEAGLSCSSVSLFATPLGSLVRSAIEAEFNLMRAEIEERDERLEERLARVCSRGTKASLQTAMQLNDLSRAIVPAWREVGGAELFAAYARAGGELQAGRSYADVKAGLADG